jgi:hypothetical protein
MGKYKSRETFVIVPSRNGSGLEKENGLKICFVRLNVEDKH